MTDSHRYSQEERRKIVEAILVDREVAEITAAELVAMAKHPDHPAHGWFTWDLEAAAHKTWMSEARAFLTFRVEDALIVGTPLPDHIVFQEGFERPGMVSPLDRRQDDNPVYILTDTVQGMEAMRHQAVHGGYGLKAWLRRNIAFLTNEERSQVQTVADTIEATLN